MSAICGRWWLLLAGLSFPWCLSAATAATAQAQLLEQAETHRLLLIGEIHGTTEVPALIADLATQMADVDELVIGLEIPRDEQTRIDTFIESAGTDEDRAELLQGAFWTRDYQDGRSSTAMIELLERLRQLRLKSSIQVLALDQVAGGMMDGDSRDRVMAERLTDMLKAKPRVRALVLAGNFHTRMQKGAPWDQSYEFLGYRLRQFKPYAVEIMGISGSAWTCTGVAIESCKARDFPESELSAGIDLGDELNEREHHGMWRLPHTSASLPAKLTQSEPAE